MKKSLLLLIFIFASLHIYSQTDGISYQAVIIDPNGVELPGVDSNGNILPNAKIAIRFTILDATNSEEYQEVQSTETDLYGRINLIIGSENRENFALVNWDGTPKDLKVEIDFKGSGNNFVDMSREQLTFVPFSYHRNILARGTLIVDDTTDLNGELVVQGPTNLNSTLNVNNNNDTNLSGELNVEGKTILKNNFEVDGLTTMNDSLQVKAKSNFSGNMQVTADAVFEGKMDFLSEEPANFNSMVIKDSMDVEGPSNLNGQVIINALSNKAKIDSDLRSKGLDTGGSEPKSFRKINDKIYSTIVQGQPQGLAILVNGIENNPNVGKETRISKENIFISFLDQGTETSWGRIEGQSIVDQRKDGSHLAEHAGHIYNIGIGTAELAIWGAELIYSNLDLGLTIADVRACVGLGACVVSPGPTKISSAIFRVILDVANGVIKVLNLRKAVIEEGAFLVRSRTNIGVSYSSGSADYAEWIPKQNIADVFTPGELVGIKNGFVTKNTWGVEKIMIVSTNPIVLGNMPQPGNEANSVKIAFMGQVPVKIIGKVSPGDYVLPNELGGGFAKAVDPKDMETRDYKKVAGVAWNVLDEITEGLTIVNVAVGINTNDLTEKVAIQEEEIKALREVFDQLSAQVSESNTVLANLLPGYSEALGNSEDIRISQTENAIESKDEKNIGNNIYYPKEDDIIYFEVSNEQIEIAITMAREQYVEMLKDKNQVNKIFIPKNGESKSALNDIVLMPIKDHPFWQKIDNDPSYKEEIIQFIQSGMEKAYHTHKKYAHNFTDLKVR